MFSIVELIKKGDDSLIRASANGNDREVGVRVFLRGVVVIFDVNAKRALLARFVMK